GRPPLAVRAGGRPLLPVRPRPPAGRGRAVCPTQAAPAQPPADPTPARGPAGRPPPMAGGPAEDADPRADAPPFPPAGPQPPRTRRGRGDHRTPAPPLAVPSRPVPRVGGLGMGPPPRGPGLRVE